MNAKKLYLLYFFLVIFTLALAAVKTIQFVNGLTEGAHLVSENASGNRSALAIPAEFFVGNIRDVRIVGQQDSTCNITATLQHEGNIKVIPNDLTVVVANALAYEGSIFVYFICCILLSWGMIIVYIIIILFLYKLFIRLKKAIQLEQVFYIPLIKALRYLGLLLIVENILELLLIYANGRCTVELLALEGFEVHTVPSLDIILGIFGISLLFIAQVFKVGYKMQEEQKLTI